MLSKNENKTIVKQSSDNVDIMTSNESVTEPPQLTLQQPPSRLRRLSQVFRHRMTSSATTAAAPTNSTSTDDSVPASTNELAMSILRRQNHDIIVRHARLKEQLHNTAENTKLLGIANIGLTSTVSKLQKVMKTILKRNHEMKQQMDALKCELVKITERHCGRIAAVKTLVEGMESDVVNLKQLIENIDSFNFDTSVQYHCEPEESAIEKIAKVEGNWKAHPCSYIKTARMDVIIESNECDVNVPKEPPPIPHTPVPAQSLTPSPISSTEHLALERSDRLRRSTHTVNYAEPALKGKLRKGDKHTFGN